MKTPPSNDVDESAAGFSLLELVAALGIGTMILMTAVASVHGLLYAVSQPATAAADAAALQVIQARLAADAGSASVIQIAPDGGTVRFLSMDQNHLWTTTAYALNSGLQQTSLADGTVHQTMVDPYVTAFTARFIPAAQLAQSREKSSVLFTNIAAPQTYTTQMDAMTATSGVYEIAITRGTQSGIQHLQTAVAPTGFGVESGLQWHASLGRQGATHRVLFVGQKTVYTITGEVDYTRDNWQTYQIWCNYVIYDKLDVGDPRAMAENTDPNETAAAIFSGCQNQTGQTGPGQATMQSGVTP